jgi:predicted ArsR family transcriptional regulator
MPIARSTDRQTSHDAAASVTNVTEVQRKILGRFLRIGPMTDAALVDAMNTYAYDTGDLPVSQSGIRTRRKELERAEFVEDQGYTDRLPSGRQAVVFDLTDKGRQEALK